MDIGVLQGNFDNRLDVNHKQKKPAMINWILQKNLTKPEILERIKSALIGIDETWEEVEVLPFSDEIPAIKNKNSFKIIYGSTTFMLNAFKDNELKAGVFFDPTRFQMSNYVAKWKDKVLNADGQLVKFGELKIKTTKGNRAKKV